MENRTKIGNKGMLNVNSVLEALHENLTEVRLNLKDNGIGETAIRETIGIFGKMQNIQSVYANFEKNEKMSLDEEEILEKFENAENMTNLDLRFENGEPETPKN
jgi:hypothetical protein